MFMANMNVKAQCPTGWDGPNYSTVTVNGCSYIASWCYRVFMGLHEIAVCGWTIMPPCNPSNYENDPTVVKDAVLRQIAESGFFQSEWGLTIPECPQTLCIIRWHDALCYSGWIPITLPPPYLPPNNILYIMDVCDNEVRSCDETVRFCWETDDNGVRTLVIWRQGAFLGPDCPEKCKPDCDK